MRFGNECAISQTREGVPIGKFSEEDLDTIPEPIKDRGWNLRCMGPGAGEGVAEGR